MELVTVGSGTVVPHPERTCASHFLRAGDRRILLDCGPGATHHLARFGLPWDALTDIAITHFHTDHIGDLPILFFALRHALATPRRAPLRLLGPAGTRDRLDRLADAFGDHLRDPGFPVEVVELADDDGRDLGDGVRLRARATPHTDASLAYRVESGGLALGYTGDTGPSEALGDFLRGVDLLLAECSLPDALAIDTHLTPSRVAALARRAEPALLLLTHVYPQLEGSDLPALVREAGWGGEVRVAEDGSRLPL